MKASALNPRYQDMLLSFSDLRKCLVERHHGSPSKRSNRIDIEVLKSKRSFGQNSAKSQTPRMQFNNGEIK